LNHQDTKNTKNKNFGVPSLAHLCNDFLLRRTRSADLHSAEHRGGKVVRFGLRPADYKTAIQQNTILRYFGCGSAELSPEDVPDNFSTGLPAAAGIKPATSRIAARPG
jgi:hypothetical protein